MRGFLCVYDDYDLYSVSALRFAFYKGCGDYGEIGPLYQNIYADDYTAGCSVSSRRRDDGFGHVRLALFCSAFRKCVYLAGLIAFPALISAEAAFLAEPVADIIAATMTIILFFYFFPRIIRQREKMLGVSTGRESE